MSSWLTDKSRIEQGNNVNEWYLLDNELYKDENGSIYLVPRGYKTDNYTIPDWIAWLGGNKSKWDVRPSHIHDFICQYHGAIKINSNAIIYNYLKIFQNKKVCEDIPIEYLSFKPMTKWQADCLFKRAMKATTTIPKKIYNLYRCGVVFNFGWLGNHPPYDFKEIYKHEFKF